MQKNQHNFLLNSLATSLHSCLLRSFSSDLSPDTIVPSNDLYDLICAPPSPEMGQLAFPCFTLAKLLKKSPVQIANRLEAHFICDTSVRYCKASGPYLNFFLNQEWVFNNLFNRQILSELFFKTQIFTDTPKTMIEYSQPNTHKVLHVGHMRNLCLGNALTNILRFAQIDLITATYPGDVGTHVAKCLWYLKKHNKAPIPLKRKGAFLGELYTKAHGLIDDQKEWDVKEQTKRELTEILKQIHDEDGDYFDLWKQTRQWSIDLMHEVYNWADVFFDRWFFESEMDAPSVTLIKDLLQKGVFIQNEGATGMDLTSENLGFCMVLKSDGTGLYATKDILLASKKFEEFAIEKSIYIVDDRQDHHFKQVFKVLEKMGYKNAQNCMHLKYNVVELPDGAMSSRKGNIIPLMDLIEKMQETIKLNYLNKYLNNQSWTTKEVDHTAQILANGAIKYGMIRMDNTRKIIFDLDQWLKLEGETGPYLQYVGARIQSLLKKAKFTPLKINCNVAYTKEEINLITKLCFFNSVIESSALQYKTSLLTSYLYDLCKLFNSFYASQKIIKEKDKNIRLMRLSLSYSTLKILRVGLSLVGIKIPLKM